MEAERAEQPIAMADADVASNEIEALYVGLVRTYHHVVLGYVVSLTNNVPLSEDLTQDTFLRAYLALPSIGAPDNPRAWLLRIATNATIDHMRRRKRIGWVPLGKLAHRLRAPEVAREAETAHPIQRALATLRPDQQAILMLFAHVGLSAPEVAEVLGISPAAARKRRQRAREAFTVAYRRETS